MIATPIVLNIIEDSKKNATQRSVDNYLHAVEMAVANKNMKEAFKPSMCDIQSSGNLMCGTKLLEVKVTGEKPTSGTVNFINGKIDSYYNIYVGEQNVSKESNDKDIIITDELYVPAKRILDSLCIATDVSTVTTGNIPTGAYNNGDEYICEVKNGLLYHFFIVSKDLNDDGSIASINLMVDRNMKSGGVVATSKIDSPAWVSKTDYDNFYNTYTGTDKITKECSATGTYTCYYSGPQTALNYLDTIVENWENLPKKNYITDEQPVVANSPENGTEIGTWRYITDAGWPGYPSITRNTRGRILTVQEAIDNGCMFEYDVSSTEKYYLGTCPLYMVNYTQFKTPTSTYENEDPQIASKYQNYSKIDGIRGYWLSTSNAGYGDKGHCAIGIHDNGVINCKYSSEAEYYGVRPVITLTTEEMFKNN